ncbi:hypothetical protein ACO2RV_09690 [Ancylobacter sp. VNQ12]|uniref:hypothetical protein n=1 Tax=Ancylobacter sp. VNQ12 TaxID=3400920 RepID=UPI003C0C045A
MNFQVDFGNLAVGLATMAIAMVTFFTSISNIKSNKNQKISDYRMIWISELREALSLFYRLQYELALIKRDYAKSSGFRKQELAETRRRLFFDISAVKTRMLLMLNPASDNEAERKLEKLLRKSVSDDVDEARIHRKEMVDLTRSILKSEWNRVKNEIQK